MKTEGSGNLKGIDPGRGEVQIGLSRRDLQSLQCVLRLVNRVAHADSFAAAELAPVQEMVDSLLEDVDDALILLYHLRGFRNGT